MPLGFNISEVKKENINEKVKESSLFFKSCIYAVDSAFGIVFSFLGDYIKNIKNDDERKEFESSSFFIKIKEISLSVLSTTKEPTNKRKNQLIKRE